MQETQYTTEASRQICSSTAAAGEGRSPPQSFHHHRIKCRHAGCRQPEGLFNYLLSVFLSWKKWNHKWNNLQLNVSELRKRNQSGAPRLPGACQWVLNKRLCSVCSIGGKNRFLCRKAQLFLAQCRKRNCSPWLIHPAKSGPEWIVVETRPCTG